MTSFLRALIVFALLCGSTAVGFLLKSQLLERYAQPGALESMSLIISFLVTITAIVVGLLINATKSFIDATQEHWAIFAGQLIRLDQSMCNYGSECEQMRRQLQSFTAAAIVNFWRADDIPTGVNYPDVRNLSKDEATQVLSDLVNRIELGIIGLKSPDPLHERLAADCFDQYKEFARARWSLLLAPQNSLPSALPQNAGRLDYGHIRMLGPSRASQSLGDNCNHVVSDYFEQHDVCYHRHR